jgi:hypothetical protein
MVRTLVKVIIQIQCLMGTVKPADANMDNAVADGVAIVGGNANGMVELGKRSFTQLDG